MAEELRVRVIEAIEEIRPLKATRTMHLDLLLKNSGQKMFPLVTSATSVAMIPGRESTNVMSRSNPTTSTPPSYQHLEVRVRM